MQLTIRYETLLKRAAGVAVQTFEVADPCDVREVVRQLAQHACDSVRPMLVDETGQLQPSLLLFVNDQQIVGDCPHTISEGDEVTLMTPISGG